MDDEDNYQRYGTALPLIEEAEVPSKKPISIEDQIVTDENGKRRFHGAFTGGFSAGYWNTVGSQEGWTPQNFKSSRKEKATQREKQLPEHFMDDEDLGEFGIAPQQIQVRSDFAVDSDKSRKRKHVEPIAGPIPGTPVLHVLLKPVNDKVAVRILKSWGWRPGQGIGPRQTRKEKKLAKERNKRELYLMQQYGYDPGTKEKSAAEEKYNDNDNDDDMDDNDYDDDDDFENDITFAPDDYEPMLCNAKDNRFGLGYSGLSRAPVLSRSGNPIDSQQHINLFPTLEVVGKNNKKLSIRGQAFGVGAMEEEDEDIYARDDMTKYDFSLESKKGNKKIKEKEVVRDSNAIEGFAAAGNPMQLQKTFLVDLPRDYTPRNWAERRSRFAPLDSVTAKKLEKNFQSISIEGNKLTPDERGRLLGEPQAKVDKSVISEKAKKQQEEQQKLQKRREDKTKELLERISAKSCNFTQGGIITSEGEEKPKESNFSLLPEVQREHESLLEKANNITKTLVSSTVKGDFKPFINDDAKQNRYEQFLVANLKTEEEIGVFLRDIQPVHLSEWDREMEKKEFMQARNIYKPLRGIMSDRFVTEAKLESEKQEIESIKEDDKKIVMERTKTMWKPDALLCKRYNIPEPFGGTMIETKQPKKSKMSVFDYLESSINTKANFQTPVIIPKHIEKPKPIITNEYSTQKQQQQPVVEEKKEVPVVEVDCVEKPTNTVESKTFKFVPKTDLEKQVDASRNKPISEKMELFKAIFADSDDDDVEDEEDNSEIKNKNKADLLTDFMVPKPAPAAVANLLRNTSPPRGIFSALFSNINEKREEVQTVKQEEKTSEKESNKIICQKNEPNKIAFKPRSQRIAENNSDIKEIEEDNAVYGPKIPTNLKTTTSTTSTTTKNDVDEEEIAKKIVKILENQKRSVKDLSEIADEWIEKTIVEDDESSDTTVSSSSRKKCKKKKKKQTNSDRVHKKSKKKNKKRDKSSKREHKHKKHKK